MRLMNAVSCSSGCARLIRTIKKQIIRQKGESCNGKLGGVSCRFDSAGFWKIERMQNAKQRTGNLNPNR
jgi:hypothetical protein